MYSTSRSLLFVNQEYILTYSYMNYCVTFVVLLIFFTALTDCVTSLNVKFVQSLYFVVETDGVFQPELVLSESSSTNITVQVIADDITATGE